jgi:predicted anti-sigma-YlaC factor YlaD
MFKRDMDCDELVELVTAYLEGALPRPERRRIEAHLDECEGCRTYLEQMRMTIGAAGRLTEEDVPPESVDELIRVFRDWKTGRTA